jgi:hypothetical protein
MAGGSEATALSTAKAAATSILAPSSTEHEHGRSFLGRRKGKRQAEIVASMALLSVKQTMSQSLSIHNNNSSGGMGTIGSPRHLLPPSAQPAASLALAARNTSPIRSRPPLASRPISPSRRTPFQPPAAERFEAVNNSMKDQWLGRKRAPTPTPVADKSGGSKSSSTRSSSTAASPILPPTFCTPNLLADSIVDDNLLLAQQHKIPQELPKPRPKTRDIADNLPKEDPINYNDSSTANRRRNLSPSFSCSSSGSETDSSGSNSQGMTCETYDEDTVEATAIARAIADRNRLVKESGTDAFLSNLSNMILCGMGSADDFKILELDDFAQSRDAPMDMRSNSVNSRDNDESLQSFETDEDGNESSSSVSSTSFLKELNKASFDDINTKSNNEALIRQIPLVQASALTDNIRKTMEQALELAAGTREKKLLSPSSAAPKPVIEPRQGSSISSDQPHTISLKFQPNLDEVSSISMGKPNRLQVLSQRVKFRSWMKRRRGTEGSSSGKLPMYE